jgi:predicted enzyme related to lactoylglutathione lyase
MGQPVVHFEIGSRQGDKAKQFYGQLFGWHIESHGPANMISTGSAEGIQGNIAVPDQEPKSYVTVYVQVDNVAEALAKVDALGGKVLVPASDVPGMGQFAWFADLDGNAIGLWKSA